MRMSMWDLKLPKTFHCFENLETVVDFVRKEKVFVLKITMNIVDFWKYLQYFLFLFLYPLFQRIFNCFFGRARLSNYIQWHGTLGTKRFKGNFKKRELAFYPYEKVSLSEWRVRLFVYVQKHFFCLLKPVFFKSSEVEGGGEACVNFY